MNESVKRLCLPPEGIKQAVKTLFGKQNTFEPTDRYINIKSGQWYNLKIIPYERGVRPGDTPILEKANGKT